MLSTAAINDRVIQGCTGSTVLEFVAVASRSHETARKWAGTRGVRSAHGSYAELLRDPDVEAVYVSLPNSMHVNWSVRALEAGKHVVCEKPLSRDARAVSHAFAVADRMGKVLREGFMYRFHPQTTEIRTLITDGAIGAIRHLRATLTYPRRDPATDVRTSSSLDGGALMDVGCYCVSAYRLFVGEPQQVVGHRVCGLSGVDERFVGTLLSTDGMTGQFDCGIVLPRRDVLEIVGEGGVISVPDPWHCNGAPFEVDTGKRRMAFRVHQVDAYRAELEAVSCAIREQDCLEFGREDAVAQALALNALYASAEQEVMVEVSRQPPEAGDARV